MMEPLPTYDHRDAKAVFTWRQLVMGFMGGFLFVSGILVNRHVHEVDTMRMDQQVDRSAIQTNQQAVLLLGEQVKTLNDRSREAAEWRARAEEKIDELLRAAIGIRKPMPQFGRDSQLYGTPKKTDPHDH